MFMFCPRLLGNAPPPSIPTADPVSVPVPVPVPAFAAGPVSAATVAVVATVVAAVVAAAVVVAVVAAGMRTRRRVRRARSRGAGWLAITPPVQLAPDAGPAGWRVLASVLDHDAERAARLAVGPRGPRRAARVVAAWWVRLWAPSPSCCAQWRADPDHGVSAGVWVPGPAGRRTGERAATGLRGVWPGAHITVTIPPATEPAATTPAAVPGVAQAGGDRAAAGGVDAATDPALPVGPWAVDPDQPHPGRAGGRAGGPHDARRRGRRDGRGTRGASGWMAVVELVPRGGPWAPVIDMPRSATTGAAGGTDDPARDPLRLVFAHLGHVAAGTDAEHHGPGDVVAVQVIISRARRRLAGRLATGLLSLAVRALSGAVLAVLDALTGPGAHRPGTHPRHGSRTARTSGYGDDRGDGGPGAWTVDPWTGDATRAADVFGTAGADPARVAAARAAAAKRAAGPHVRVTVRVVSVTGRSGRAGRRWAAGRAAVVASGFDVLAGHGPGAAAGVRVATVLQRPLPDPPGTSSRTSRTSRRVGRWVRRVTGCEHGRRSWAATLPELAALWHLPADPARAGIDAAPSRTRAPGRQHPRIPHPDPTRGTSGPGGTSGPAGPAS